jgi:hypothetical protein
MKNHSSSNPFGIILGPFGTDDNVSALVMSIEAGI